MDRIVWLAEVPYTGMPHRQPQLAGRLANAFDVLYVEPPHPLRVPRLRLEARGRLRVAQAAPILNARPRPIRRALGLTPVRRLAAYLGARQLAVLVRRAGWSAGGDPLMVICSNVYLIQAAVKLRPRVLVVDLCDDPRHYPGEPPWAHELLVASVRAADLVTTSSRSLEAEIRALGAARVEYLPNGVHARWLSAPVAVGTGGPVGFLGYLGPWIDFDLLDRLAEVLDPLLLELVGPQDPAVGQRVAALGRRANVRVHGPVSEEEAPAMVARFAVGIIPFVISSYTRAVNPIKLYEYAALNLPIVSTAFSPDVLAFRDVVDVCDTPQEFTRVVRERAITATRRQTRWLAEQHTWDAIAQRLLGLIREAAN